MSRKNKKKKYQKYQSNTSTPISKSKSYTDQFYSKSGADYKGNLKGIKSSLSAMTVDSVKNLFQNTESNYQLIGSYMETLRKTNGIVARTLDYITSHPTLNYNIYPSTSNLKSTFELPTIDEYIGASDYIEKYRIKTNAFKGKLPTIAKIRWN